MIERGLIYIYSANPSRSFAGCGALVEGGYVVTCRHVWRKATDTAAKAEPKELIELNIEYPHARKDDGGIRHSTARVVDLCEDETPPPDLVLLKPDVIPSDIMNLQIATNERFEVGPGYAMAGLKGRDKKNPGAVRDGQVVGTIADHTDASGLRQFTGSNPQGYWFTEGSSGSPVFLHNGQQLAGIVSLAELGANEGTSRLQEAFVVPGTTIRFHLGRLLSAKVAADNHLSRTDLAAILHKIGITDIPTVEIPRRLEKFIDAALARGREPVSPSNEGGDIVAVIEASRAKLQALDTDGARQILQTKIAEEDEARVRRLVPLLRERASIERLDFNYEAAKTTLAEITRLAPDDVWAHRELAEVEYEIQRRLRAAALDAGVTMVAPETVFLSADTVLGRDVVIEPYVVFGLGVVVEDDAVIHSFSHLDGSHVGKGASVGPFARLRPGTELGAKARIGNFVEVKAASIEAGAEVKHLTYIGDARVGEGANVGAGTITCNYDGFAKHRTDIGRRAFIGPNSALVAPVTIGDEAYVGSGSVITRDVPPGALALGRGEQIVKKGWAARLRKKRPIGKKGNETRSSD